MSLGPVASAPAGASPNSLNASTRSPKASSFFTTLHRDVEKQHAELEKQHTELERQTAARFAETAARFSETLQFINRLAHVVEAH